MLNLRQQAMEAVSRNYAPPLEPLLKRFPHLTAHSIAALLWMHVQQLGVKRFAQLLRHFEDESLWHLFWVPPTWAYEHFSERFSKFPATVKKAWLERQQEFHPHLEHLLQRYEKEGVNWVTNQEAGYPTQLKQIHDAPNLLFYKGNGRLLLETATSLAVVGTRDISDYGTAQINRILEELHGSELPIISGLAYGVDGTAHKAALKHGLPTLAVLAGGLDSIYPKEHHSLARDIIEAGGVLVSEMPLGVPPAPRLFPRRNRIIVGLAPLLWVVEGTLKSGTMVSARIALEESRDICVLPMDVTRSVAEGPIKLLKEGAIPITSAEDIAHLLDLSWMPKTTIHQETSTVHQTLRHDHKEETHHPNTTETPLKQAAKDIKTKGVTPPVEVAPPTTVYTLKDAPIPYLLQQANDNILHVDALAQQSDLPVNELLATLTMLELEGTVQRLPGNHFTLLGAVCK
jgi:DNA protecting protein DprA